MTIIDRLRGFLTHQPGPDSHDQPSQVDEDETVYPHLLVPEQVSKHTIRGLRSHSPSHENHEGIVYWAGVTVDELSAKFVTTCIVPDAETTSGSFNVSPKADAQVVQTIHENNLNGIGHVHSHPGDWTSHSPGDDNSAGLVFDGYYSIVVPNYAADGMLPFTRCGIHRYENGGFQELSDSTIAESLTSVPSPPANIDLRPP